MRRKLFLLSGFLCLSVGCASVQTIQPENLDEDSRQMHGDAAYALTTVDSTILRFKHYEMRSDTLILLGSNVLDSISWNSENYYYDPATRTIPFQQIKSISRMRVNYFPMIFVFFGLISPLVL